MMIRKELIFAILFCLQSCSAQNRKEAIRLNDEAMTLLTNGSETGSMINAIQLLDQAISADNSYTLAYTNKAQLYCKMGKYSDAVNTLNQVITIKKDFTEGIMTKGFYLEKMGRLNEAKETYKLALDTYDKKLKKGDAQDITMRLNRAFTMAFLYGKETAILEYKIIDSMYPNNSKVIHMHDVFYTFDKTEFLSTLCQ